MKKFKYILYWLPAMMLALSGCSQEELIKTGTVKEGEKAILYLSVKTPDMKVQSRASLTPEEEKTISSLCIYIFDSNGNLVGNTIHENAGAHASDKPSDGDGVISPDGKNHIAIETLTGNNRDIYVIANYHACSIEDLKGVSTVGDVKQLIAKTYGNPLSRNYNMVMVGTLLKQEIRTNGSIEVPLDHVSAKITIKVINKCPDLTIMGWTADAVPIKSYVFEREMTSDPNYHDASNIIDKSDYYYDFSDQNFAFEKIESQTYESTFYMLENRRGGRVKDRQDPPVSAEIRKDYQLKAWYAPDNASRIRILGKLGGTNSKSICINHYLGENNTNDYNVSRSTHYIYTITINSLNSINIDTNIESDNPALDVVPAADLMNIDAHADYRSFLLKTNEITDSDVKVSAEVLESVNSSVHTEWLNLAIFRSSLNHVRSSIQSIADWQQEGEINTYVRPKFIPNTRVRSELDAKGKNYAGKGLINTPEYPMDDMSLTYAKATHRMCKKITEIPTSGTGRSTPISIYLYADEYKFDAAYNAPSYREAVVRFTVQKGEQTPEYIHFTVRQYPPYRFAKMNVAGVDYLLVVERMEEYEHFSQALLPMAQQMAVGMQWGPYDLSTSPTSPDDGFTNTLKGVYTSATGDEYFKNYLPKYGCNTGNATLGWEHYNNGEIKEDGSTITTGAPDFNFPDYGNCRNAYHTIYNTTAARYCHEKNRDINGDGQIDADETFWYLPSEKEMQLFWTYHEAINLYATYYWSSTETDTNHAYAFSMENSPASPQHTYNGVSQPIHKTTVLDQRLPRVRCVRRVTLPSSTASNVSPVQPIVSHRLDGTTVVDCSNLLNNMYTADTKMGIPPTDIGSIQRANHQVYKKFEIQNKENAPSNFNSLRQGNGKCDATKGWRLPTQREMLVVYSVKDLLQEGSGFEDFKAGKYWTMTCDLSAQYIINFSTGLCEYGSFFDPSNEFYYRCVRELK